MNLPIRHVITLLAAVLLLAIVSSKIRTWARHRRQRRLFETKTSDYDYPDGQNVGLHEMAHALTYVNFTVREGRDKAFHDHFTEFSAVARPIFERMRAGEANLLDTYAATNYEEFWAVCIETFFERSNAFRKHLPELYVSLCSLLNQDPLTAEKIQQPDGGGAAFSVIA